MVNNDTEKGRPKKIAPLSFCIKSFVADAPHVINHGNRFGNREFGNP